MLSEKSFKFLNYEADIGLIGWNNKKINKLWVYNLHYFDDLNSKKADLRRNWHKSLIDSWINEIPPGKGIGWEPYPTSLRIVNWCKYYLSGNKLSEHHLKSLYTQALWLNKRIEYHLQGNHLFANAKALYFAGCFFEGRFSKLFLKKARQIITNELSEQILEDGGHFELSPMYHSIILEDLLDLVNIAKAYGHNEDEKNWQKKILPMIHWLKTMIHPDGEISFFNDAAIGISMHPSDLFSYARRLGFEEINTISSEHLQASGYVRLQTDNLVALCDVGKIGPDYLPGHSHADTLSFELSAYGHRLFVNSGISLYSDNYERHSQRSTHSHNTLQLNGRNSSQVWKEFRVANRAFPNDIKINLKGNIYEVSASHDGYKRLKGQPIHHRYWKLEDNFFNLTDKVKGSFKKAIVFYHCHPDVKINEVNKYSECIELTLPNGYIAKMQIKGAKVSIEESKWYPEFGVSISCNLIKLVMTSRECSVSITF